MMQMIQLETGGPNENIVIAYSLGGVHASSLKAKRKQKIEADEPIRQPDGSMTAIWTRLDLIELEKYRNVLIDLRDYDKTLRGSLNRDIDYIESTWRELGDRYRDKVIHKYPEARMPNFIIFVQREYL